MRASCNGCRILRKGCSEACTIRPCLEWIKSAESQANATVFLAKFYGRAGLLNLINAGPDHLRPAIFRSLLYEACGRIVNPIYGSVGLLWSGRWQFCQAAVEAVFKGGPIMQVPADCDSETQAAFLQRVSSFDIRHVSKAAGGTSGFDLNKVNKATRARFKRSGNRISEVLSNPATDSTSFRWCHPAEYWLEPSKDTASGAVEVILVPAEAVAGESRENESILSLETVEASTVASQSDVDLELTLGYETVHQHHSPFRGSSSSSSSGSFGRRAEDSPMRVEAASQRCPRGAFDGAAGGSDRVDLGLNLPA
ncbi:unnamed protein product [Spirodela intermedia]|uniref:LOB domain-containing protein n=1 Tax=Spirodela intermedia TaxID=51605 RepID=A0A7I8JSQ5_SPIIN|nr:unnamed protein product [Spirodela intermedia]CAA6673154.1 unnamed protein product [Spirodela intermedia]